MAGFFAPLGSAASLAPGVIAFNNLREQLGDSVARLSGGMSVINIGDNVAAVTIGTQLQSQSSGLKQASQNIAQGVSLAQTAAGALEQIGGLVANLQTLATQASAVSLLPNQRAFLQQQFTQTISQINSIASSTSFNGVNLLDGTLASGMTFRTGTGSSVSITIGDNRSSALFSGNIPDIATASDATAAQAGITVANSVVQASLGQAQGAEQGFFAAAGAVNGALAGVTAAVDNYLDTNTTQETAAYQRTSILLNINTAVLAQARNLQSGLLSVLHTDVISQISNHVNDGQSTATAAQTPA